MQKPSKQPANAVRSDSVASDRVGAQFTPGSWSVECDGSLVMGGQVIGKVAPDTSSLDESRANANLISSAPDMLEALKRISAAYSNLETAEYADYAAAARETARGQIADAIKASRYVIARATGGAE